jgi:putative phosphoribosyl transferase
VVEVMMEERERMGDPARSGPRNQRKEKNAASQFVQVRSGPVMLEGNLYLPEQAQGLVVFVHGSGSSRHSPRNQYVANIIQETGLGTLLFDLLTPEEEEVDLHTRHLRFDIGLLARRTIGAADWIKQNPKTRDMRLGFFGASTGAAAALIAAAERPDITGAVISRGGRPDLAISTLPRVVSPTLLIVGELDRAVIDLNVKAQQQLNAQTPNHLEVIPGATHLFEEPGALEKVARLASQWFQRYLASPLPRD